MGQDKCDTGETFPINSNATEKGRFFAGDLKMLYNVRRISDHRMTDRGTEMHPFDVASV